VGGGKDKCLMQGRIAVEESRRNGYNSILEERRTYWGGGREEKRRGVDDQKSVSLWALSLGKEIQRLLNSINLGKSHAMARNESNLLRAYGGKTVG